MIRRRSGTLGVLAAIVMTVPGSAAAAPPPTGVSPEVDELVERGINFRTAFALPNSRALAEDAARDAVRFPNRDWGVPLTEAEADEIARRADVQLWAVPAMEYAAALPEHAGVYIDQAAGGTPVFLFAGNPTSYAAGIRARLGGIEARFGRVERSYDELAALRDAVVEDRHALATDGIAVISAGIDVVRNLVVVGVEHYADGLTAQLEQRYGSGIEPRADRPSVADACTSARNCWPLKGGIELDPDSSTLTADCTSGFMAKRLDLNRLVTITAGHCVSVRGTGTVWEHANNDSFRIGQATNHTWFDGADADVGVIGVYTSQVPTIRNEFLAGFPAPTYVADIRSLTSAVAMAAQPSNGAVCRFGMNGGYRCGTITFKDVRRKSCINNDTVCKWIDHTVEVNFDAVSGDSGGPMFLNNAGYGIHVHSTIPDNPTAPAWYSPMDWVQTEWRNRFGYALSWCVSATCGI